MTEQDKNVFGCMGMVAVAVLGWAVVHMIGQGIEVIRDPEAYAQRQAALVAEAEAEASAEEQRKRDAEAAEAAAEVAAAEQAAASRLARDRANRAALERYADCQVRNQTPGYCTEDWRPTEDIRAMNEIAREGRF